MVPWGDLLVSGGCDRDVRVWNLATGYVGRSAQDARLAKLRNAGIHSSHFADTLRQYDV